VIYCLHPAKEYRYKAVKATCCLLLLSSLTVHLSAVAQLETSAAQSHTADSNTIETNQKEAAEASPQEPEITNTANTENKPAQEVPQLSISEFQYCDAQPWLDDWYCLLNYGVENSVIEVNKWFVAEHIPTAKRAQASGKLRFGWEPRSGDLSPLDFRFKIRVKLPALQDRVELLLSDDEGDVNQQAVKAARNQQLGSNDQATVALQFKDKPDSKIAYRIGLGRGSQVYTRARYSDRIDLSDQNSMNYYAEVNYYTDDQIGVETKISLNHTISSNEAIEFDNTFRYRDKSEDLFWRHEIQYLYLHDSKTSYLFTAMVDGLNKPSYREEQVLISMRYKRNILRPWLFLELEPFVLWLREENFRTSFGVAIRAEVHFPQY
jgi:hypothetical protein